MRLLTIVLHSFIVLISLSELYKGVAVEGFTSADEISTVLSIANENGVILERNMDNKKNKIKNGKPKKKKETKRGKRKTKKKWRQKNEKNNLQTDNRQNKRLKNRQTDQTRNIYRYNQHNILKKCKRIMKGKNKRKNGKHKASVLKLINIAKKTRQKINSSKSQRKKNKQIARIKIKHRKNVLKRKSKQVLSCCEFVKDIKKREMILNKWKQVTRINDKKDSIIKKAKKQTEFENTLKFLVRAVGGNESNPICKKFTHNLDYTNLTTDLRILSECAKTISTICVPNNVSTIYQPNNTCNESLTELKKIDPKECKPSICNISWKNDAEKLCKPKTEERAQVEKFNDCVKGTKLQFQLKGNTGEEEVTISVDDKKEKVTLNTTWQKFSYPRPSSGSFSVEYHNENRPNTAKHRYVVIKGHESQVADILPSYEGDRFNEEDWNCGTTNEYGVCDMLRRGVLHYNGTYTYTHKGSPVSIRICKKASENAQTYIVNCPPKDIVGNMVREEEGEIVHQVDTFDYKMGDVSSYVPPHAGRGETTFIMDKHSNIMMEVTPHACYIREIPEEIDPEGIETSDIDEVESSDPIFDVLFNSTSVVYNDGPASLKDCECLSPKMVLACGNKPIYKTVEERTYEFELFNASSFSHCKKPKRQLKRRQSSIPNCKVPSQECLCNNGVGCLTSTRLKISASNSNLHQLNIKSLCLDCCGDTEDETKNCKCASLRNITAFLRFLNDPHCYDGPCPDGFYDCGDGVCRADILKEPVDKCSNTGLCPKGRYDCAGQCWSESFPRKNMRECNGKCQSKNIPCNGKCHNDYIPCNNGRCIPNDGSIETHECNGKCLFAKKPCGQICPGKRKRCGDECISRDSKRWECNGICQGPQFQCNGICNNETTNRKPCGKYKCFTVNDNNPRNCKNEETGEDECLDQNFACNGQCSKSRILCEDKYCYREKDTWICNDKCQSKTTPCSKTCPEGYYLCLGRCRKQNPHYPISNYKPCNGYPILSTEHCDDICHVGDVSIKINETLEYPEKCMVLKCTRKFIDNLWKGNAYLESQTMGKITFDPISGRHCCFYNGTWLNSTGSLIFDGTYEISGWPSMTTSRYNLRNVVKRRNKFGNF